MRKATIVTVTPNLQLEIPPEIQAKLQAGEEFRLFITWYANLGL